MTFLTIVLLTGALFLGLIGGVALEPAVIALACFLGLIARITQAQAHHQQLLKAGQVTVNLREVIDDPGALRTEAHR